MRNVSPTIADIARSVARLDENADIPATGHKTIDGVQWSQIELVHAVAANIKFSLRNSGLGKKSLTNNAIKVVLYTHGASAFTVEQYASKIGSEIRNGLASQF